jgi:hypothetical protein
MKLEVWHSPAGYELAACDEGLAEARAELNRDARLVRVIEAKSWASATQEFMKLLDEHAAEDRALIN